MVLSRHQQHQARHVIHQGCRLMLAHSDECGYTQGDSRWEGIDRHMLVVRHQFPRESDCSSSVSWLLWNGLRHVGVHHDRVNNEHWRAGFTGTIAHNGHRVHRGFRFGDLVLYGYGWPYEHVALYVGHGRVWSHGSPGARILPMDYRPDRAQVRRFI